MRKIFSLILIIINFFNTLKNIIEKQIFRYNFQNSGCYLGFDVKFFNPDQIKIGNNVFIGDKVLMNAGKGGKILVGENVAIAEGVKIISWLKEVDQKNNEKKIICKNVIIGNYCRIGYNAIIMPGVKIGDGAKISPLSVVYHDVPADDIVMGNPAQSIK